MTKEEIEIIKNFIEGLDKFPVGGTLYEYEECLGCSEHRDVDSSEKLVHDPDCKFFKIQKILKKYEDQL